MSKRTPTSITRRGRYTVRVYDEQAYAANIQEYYGRDTSRPTDTCQRDRVPFEQKKPGADLKWASWRGPMLGKVAG